MRSAPSQVAILFILLAGLLAGSVTGYVAALDDARAGERAVLALDGVGHGWADTLRHIIGRDVQIDTMTDAIRAHYDGELLGIQESWYDRVRVSTDIGSYMRFSQGVCASRLGGLFRHTYEHPAWLAYPPAILAHEFGHVYQRLPVGARWRVWHSEVFADRFASAVLQLRGWLPADTADADMIRLRHELRYRLIEGR